MGMWGQKVVAIATNLPPMKGEAKLFPHKGKVEGTTCNGGKRRVLGHARIRYHAISNPNDDRWTQPADSVIWRDFAPCKIMRIHNARRMGLACIPHQSDANNNNIGNGPITLNHELDFEMQ
jgi:hypothetical protein